MGQSNNSEELQRQKSEELQQPGESDELDQEVSDVFTDVDLEDINRDDLPPAMQSHYDKLLEMRANMQRDYTQKTQGLAQLRKEAELWGVVSGHPEIGPRLQRMLYRAQEGLSIDDGTTAQESPKEPDVNPQEDPLGYIDSRIETKMEQVLGKYLPELRDGIARVSGFVQNNQSKLEFDNLCNDYPALKAIGLDALQRVQRSYQSNGRVISMREALGILAIDEPKLLTNRGTTATTRKPAVERPRQTAGAGKESPPLPRGVRELQRQALERSKGGPRSLLEIAQDAISKKFGR